MTTLNTTPRLASAFSLLALAGAAALLAAAPAARAEGAKAGTWMPGTFKFMGNAACVSCHSEGKKKGGSNKEGNQIDTWEKDDPHHKSFESLSSDESKKIAGKLGIKDAAADAKCLTCHAVNASADRRGPKWTIEEGNSCESCHGPAEKYLAPHEKAGWTAEQRKSKDAKAMMSELGIFDTTNLVTRTEMCINCHLSIDKAMVDAGHPALKFEMGSYNVYATGGATAYTPHWENEKKSMTDAKLWAIGQAVAAKAGADAGLTAIYAKGVEIAKKNFGADTADGLAKATYTPEKCAAAAKELAETAGSAKTKQERLVVALGTYSLVAAFFDAKGGQTPDAINGPYDTAMKGEEGAAFVDACKKMAEMAK